MPDRTPITPRRRASIVLWLLLAFMAAGALSPAAWAAGSLNNELAEKAQQQEAETPTTTATTNTTATSESNSSNTKTLVIVASAAGALLAAIAFVIVRDARKVAPVTESPMAEAGSAGRSAAELRRRRARAKAARRQRKRNR